MLSGKFGVKAREGKKFYSQPMWRLFKYLQVRRHAANFF